MTTRDYKRKSICYFWLSILSYFLPYVAATAALLPFMEEATGMKWGIGLALVAINAIPFVLGVLRNFLAHFPFVNWFALVFIMLSGFFQMQAFRDYVWTFTVIESLVFLGGAVACIFWSKRRKYKAKAETGKTMHEMGVI